MIHRSSKSVTEPLTVRQMIEERIYAYNKSIEEYANKYMDKFYDSWRDSISDKNVLTFGDIKEFTFTVVDDYFFRPIESWNLFLDNVLSNHPDITWAERVSNTKFTEEKKPRTMYVFNYENCLDDVLD